MTAATYCIERLVLPDAVDSADAGNFLDVGALCDALALQTWGNLDRSTPPEARLQFWRDNDYQEILHFFVRQDGRMAARCWVRLELRENLGSAFIHVDVLEEFSGRGIGRALLRHAEGLAAAAGRTILQSYTEHPAGFDPDIRDATVRPATGTGALPADARGVRFAQQAGYRLEQVSRFSALDVRAHAASWGALEREARATAGEDYELVSWTGRCPEEHAGQLAALMARMSTDAPSGDLSCDPEDWDVARVRHIEDTWQRAGLASLVAAARHRGSGELAAYSVLQLTPSKPWLGNQDDTLVTAGHRGHRLGMLVKIRNLRRLLMEYPQVERVVTFNAAENEHMLAINVALGFRAAGYDGEWQRTIDAPGGQSGRTSDDGTPAQTGIC